MGINAVPAQTRLWLVSHDLRLRKHAQLSCRRACHAHRVFEARREFAQTLLDYGLKPM